MARIRKIEIERFRGIRSLDWNPNPGVNCLIGRGDSGKSSVLEAIDLCLGARRQLQFTDADFYQLNTDEPIKISVTLGDLPDTLKSLEGYGLYVRGFNRESGEVEDEPDRHSETVLTVRLTVTSDLEPSWSLFSLRAEVQGQSRTLSWGDRANLAPAKIGVMADYHLGWRRGSVLNRVSEERADTAAALARAARDARAAFGEETQEQLTETLEIVAVTAQELGIAVGDQVKAMLDAQSVSFTGGTISLHNERGVPLRSLGTGSARLLVAGLQRKAAAQSSIILVDEVEYGLEPHRILRFLGSLGVKEKAPPLQLFMTTHSPVAVRELSAPQIFIIRAHAEKHTLSGIGDSDDVQGTIRLYPEALLANSVLVCEGASEVGLVRGLDQHRTAKGRTSLTALGIALVDCSGGDADRPFRRAEAFRNLGYRVAVLRDDDKKPTASVEEEFLGSGGTVISWRDGRALEDELFHSLSDVAVDKLIELGIELNGESLVNEHIKSACDGSKDLDAIRLEMFIDGFTAESRTILARAARSRAGSWFKSVTRMERAALDIVGDDLAKAETGFVSLVNAIFAWTGDAG